MRRFWSGHLYPGDIVFHNGKRCQVAGDSRVGKSIISVPAGHVPIFYCDAVGFGKGPVYAIPLDDVDISSKGSP